MTFDNLPKLNLKNKIIAMLVIFALSIFSLICFIVVPTVRDIKAVGGAIEEQMIDLEKKYIKGSSLRQLTEDLKEIEPKLSLLDQIFINENRELEFITTLENEANKARVSQKINLSVPDAAENSEYKKNNLQLLANGQFNGLLKYLINLEYLSYYINVKSLEISPTGGRSEINNQLSIDGGSGDLNLFINADTYWK